MSKSDQIPREEEIESLVREIEAAFAGVVLGDGVGLWEGYAMDGYESVGSRTEFRLRDEKRDWRRITREDFDDCYSSPSFFDAEGFRFHIPAMMIMELYSPLEHDVVLDLTRTNKHTRSQHALLSHEQRAVIRRFLEHMGMREGYECDRGAISKALEDYWV